MKKKQIILPLILLVCSMIPLSAKIIKLNHKFQTKEGCQYLITGWVDINVFNHEINCYSINVNGLSTNPANCPKVNLQLETNC